MHTMSEEKFLAFKGLKQYDPGMGWASVHNFTEQNATEMQSMSQHSFDEQQSLQHAQSLQALADAVREDALPKPEEVLQDPLLGELFEQLNQPPQDELAHNWKIIATSVNVLSQRMSQQRELRRRLFSIDEELDKLRNTILQDLQEIQRASDQQLSMSRLRAEVSSLAQARLSSKLRNTST
jgi:hypothetical protein